VLDKFISVAHVHMLFLFRFIVTSDEYVFNFAFQLASLAISNIDEELFSDFKFSLAS